MNYIYRKQLKAVFIGGQSLLVNCAERFIDRGHTIVLVASSDPIVRRWASEKGIRQTADAREIDEQIGSEPFDYLFSVVNLSLVKPQVIGRARVAAINFHDGPLPEYAGLNVTSWAILNQKREHGVTWHLMGEQADVGDIVKQVRFPIDADETALTLNAKCYEAAFQSFEDMLLDLEDGKVSGRNQDLAVREYFSRSKKPVAAGSIDWTRPAAEISALVRGLDHGAYANRLATAKVWSGGIPLIVRKATDLGSRSTDLPGAVSSVSETGVVVATGTNDLLLSGFTSVLGAPVNQEELVSAFRLRPGAAFDHLDAEKARRLSLEHESAARHEAFWITRLENLEPARLPGQRLTAFDRGDARYAEAHFKMPPSIAPKTNGDLLLAAFCGYLSRVGDKREFSVAFRHPGLSVYSEDWNWLSPHVPLRVSLEKASRFQEFKREIDAELALARRHGSYALDMAQRYPALTKSMEEWHGAPPAIVLVRQPSLQGASSPPVDADIAIIFPDDGGAMTVRYRLDAIDADEVSRLAQQFSVFLEDVLTGNKPISQCAVVPPAEIKTIASWNDTGAAYETHLCIHQMFESQVRLTPKATALVVEDEEVTYEELNAISNALAHELISRGVRAGALVGLLMERSIEMVAAMMAILKAGGAYVPLDPGYPVERLRHMVSDAGLTLIVSSAECQPDLLFPSVPSFIVDGADRERNRSATNPTTCVTPGDLAYVIYTSGSTGKPKGVMVEHRNVANFFAGMDARINHDAAGVWLAVTSISFDISVLEIFWTLARGFKVVLYKGESNPQAKTNSCAAQESDQMGFSLYYFGNDEGMKGRKKYSALLEGARFADENGFEAVWTPERHFHAFGGLFPNTSVAGAAVAAITENVGVRAGSCVLPLHSPIRVAEDWGLIDNLSNGRVGIAFATGWQPTDFAISPDAYEDRHKRFAGDIEAVRALWRGEARAFRGPRGEVQISTLPRPVQEELPFWITAAGNPETFRLAGQMGANILTHLLGQTTEELANKLDIYRQAWREAGHPGSGKATLMLHTFVAADEDFVREQVHDPFIAYLRTATDLVKQSASSFPAFRNATKGEIDGAFDRLTEADVAALLEHAFKRYYETSGLFGTPESCLAMVRRLANVGVNEIACLIDFGVRSEVVLENLPYLNELRMRANRAYREGDTPKSRSLGQQIIDHSVTHLQCTPSLAEMLINDREARTGLAQLRNLMVGGEALHARLAKELFAIVEGPILNMYGPTETTVWSATYRLDEPTTNVPIGKPIANTQIHVLDENLQPLPIGVPGEIFIGGDGVVRGYLNRPELTSERFIANPFGEGRIYRTGDRGKWREDGVLEFLGRLDNQVKVRGHRIEIGEIEFTLAQYPSVSRAIVVPREDEEGHKRLVAYVVPEEGAALGVDEMREHLQKELPDFMVPGSFVILDAFPFTPNGKIDRNKLPAPDSMRPAMKRTFVGPRTPNEKTIARFFEETLSLEGVGVFDNFIELGGDSLSAVQLFLKIEQTFSVQFPLETFFKAGTVAGLAEEVERALAVVKNTETIQ